MYEEGSFRWMDDIQALKEIIVSAGFSIKFMDMSTEMYEPTEGKCNKFNMCFLYTTVVPKPPVPVFFYLADISLEL